MPSESETGFDVQVRWKEEVVYWEGRRGFLFDAGWGVHPYVLYVPSEDDWNAVTPEWMADRRPEIVARLAERSDHQIGVDDYPEPRAWRNLTR